MLQIRKSREQLKNARAAIDAALEAEEPDQIGQAIALAGDGIARAVDALDFIKGFRADVIRASQRLAERG